MTSLQISGLREDLETIELLSAAIFQENKISAKTKISEFHADSIESEQILPVLIVTFGGVSAVVGIIKLVLSIQDKKSKTATQKKTTISIKIEANNSKELNLKISGSMADTEIKKCLNAAQNFVDNFLSADDGMSLRVSESEKSTNEINIKKVNLLFSELLNRLTDIRRLRPLLTIKNGQRTIFKSSFDKVHLAEVISSLESKTFYLHLDKVKDCKNIFHILERENILSFHEISTDIRILNVQDIFVGYQIEKLPLFKEVSCTKEFIFSECKKENYIAKLEKIHGVIEFTEMAKNNGSIQKLLPLLRPYLRDENERRAYLIRALGMDTPVLNRLVLNTPVDVFITSMVKELVDFGKIASGKPALCALLEVIREDMGVDNKARIDELLRQLREELTETPVEQEQVQSRREAQNLRAVILTAIPVEFVAVRAHLTDLQEEIHSEGTIYERGSFLSNGQLWQVGIVEVGAGNAEAAVETKRAIDYFKPSVVLFVGIAGGIKDVALGDVVAATKVYGYESGKVVEESFQPRPNTSLVSYRLEQRAKAEARKDDWLQRIGESIPTPKPCAFTGAIAAGDKVVASTNSDVYKLLRSNYGDALAVEMESHGFLKAVRANPEINALIIRGISDLIEGKSNADATGSQEKAARHASAFAFEILAKVLSNGNK